MIVQAAPPEHYRWIQERTQCSMTPGFRALEALDHGRIAGMVGYDFWTPAAVNMHVALEDPRSCLPLIKHAFRLPFEAVGKAMVLAVIVSDNVKSIEFVKRLGFRETYRVKDGWSPGVDQVLFEMRRDECRWIGKVA